MKLFIVTLALLGSAAVQAGSHHHHQRDYDRSYQRGGYSERASCDRSSSRFTARDRYYQARGYRDAAAYHTCQAMRFASKGIVCP